MSYGYRKIAKQISRLNAEELNELSNILLNTHGINSNIYRYSAGITTVGKSECDLFLVSAGSRKLMVLKACKEYFGWGLRDAKRILDNAPCSLKEFMDCDEAEKLQEELEELGAIVEIQ